jgi:Ca-activated chloride channel family protein
MKKQNKFLLLLIGLLLFGIIFLVISLTKDVGKSTIAKSMEGPIKELDALYKTVKVKDYQVQRSNAIVSDEKIAILPDISEYPFVVNPTTDSYITIYSSLDKANEDYNAWLCKVADNFNNSNFMIDGVRVSVGIRAMSSNLAVDFITSEKYIPDLFIPASSIYGLMLDNSEKNYTVASESIVNNVSGIIISSKVKNAIETKYKTADIESIVNCVLNKECIIGYTNPLSNEDGLNYLLTLLSTFDNKNPLSDTAIDKLKAYQDSIPYVPYDIVQLEDSLFNGTIDGFVSNYQTYYSTPDLRNSCEFIPCGMVQSSPAYIVGNLSQVKSGIVTKFVEFCGSEESQRMATDVGFNAKEDYQYTGYKYEGKQVIEAQNIWKREKNGSSDLTAVFVSDISGSMEGSPLLKLKASLNRASTFIDENTNIGLVTFSDTVNITLPIAKFDNTQKGYFLNAVKSMRASGGTAMFDAIIVAEHMLMEKYKENPNTRLMLFVLTDGESNRGYGFEDIESISKDLRIPIYTIGYNADIDVLKEVSDINEASTMDADSDNVIYKLESLFNSQM